MTRYLMCDGVDLRQPKGAWTATSYTFLHSTPARVSNKRGSSRRHGSGFTAGTWEANDSGVVTMAVTNRHPSTGVVGDYAVLTSNEDAVKAMLLRADRPVLIAEMYSTTNPSLGRQALCEVTNQVEHSTNANRTFSTLRFEISVIDAFWRDVTEETVTAATIARLRGGSAPIVDPLILIQGSGASVYRVTDQVTGKWIEWRGALSTSQWARLDPLNETGWQVTSAAWSGGAEKPGLVRTGAGGFEVHPDVQLTLPANTQIRARRAFL